MDCPKRYGFYSTVHPHACGEHLLHFCPMLSKTGSSPRMWGTLDSVLTTGAESRFIPTHVGNIPFRQFNDLPGSVHPHACGEHWFCFGSLSQITGSSPRMWGTSKLGKLYHGDCRFIPTHVGNISVNATIVIPDTVHPHACGEHNSLANRFAKVVHPHACGEHTPPHWACAPCCGSSPRMWGTCSVDRCT